MIAVLIPLTSGAWQIMPGDKLVSVDGLPVKGMHVAEIENIVSGAYGTQVRPSATGGTQCKAHTSILYR
jgi:hypothetical protein